MTDITLDALLEAVRFILTTMNVAELEADDVEDFWRIVGKLDVLIAQRKGRSDGQPAGLLSDLIGWCRDLQASNEFISIKRWHDLGELIGEHPDREQQEQDADETR